MSTEFNEFAGLTQQQADMVTMDGIPLDLNSLYDVDIDEVVDTYGYSALPTAVYVFEIKEVALVSAKRKIKEVETNVPGIAIKCVIIDVVGMEDKSVDVTTLIGREYTKTAASGRNINDSIGEFKGILIKAKVPFAGKLSEVCAGAVGVRFSAKLVTKPSSHNKDVLYTNMELRSVSPAV